MTRPLTTIGFDADDTLWHNERFFALTQDHFAELLRQSGAICPIMGLESKASRFP